MNMFWRSTSYGDLVEDLCKLTHRYKKERVSFMKFTNSLRKFTNDEMLCEETTIGESIDRTLLINSSKILLSNATKRLLEDFSDVDARNVIIKRLEGDVFTASEYLKVANQKVKDANEICQMKSDTYGIIIIEAQENLEHCLNERKLALSNLKQTLAKLIEAKKNFTRFKTERIRHGIKTYGEALIEYSKSIKESLAPNGSTTTSSL